jgi:hypothetical protein
MGAYNTNGIFNSNARDRSVQKLADKIQGFGLLAYFVLEPPSPANRQVCAWRVCDHQVETVSQNIPNIA